MRAHQKGYKAYASQAQTPSCVTAEEKRRLTDKHPRRKL